MEKNKHDVNNGNVICDNCGEAHSYTEHVTDRVDYTVTEKERLCNECGQLMDYWAYGNWESSSENQD